MEMSQSRSQTPITTHVKKSPKSDLLSSHALTLLKNSFKRSNIVFRYNLSS